MDTEYYVYMHTFSNKRIYIGKGKGSRSTDFRQRSEYWKRHYMKYGDPIVDIIDDNLNEAAAFELEEFCILEAIEKGYALGDSLINFTLGGEGTSGHNHTDKTKKIISDASKQHWEQPEIRESTIKNLKAFWSSPEGKQKKSQAMLDVWKDETYRKTKLKNLKDRWEKPEQRKKMSDYMTGSNNPSAKRANVYDYKTDEVIAVNIISAQWARENGYSRPKLQITAKADRTKPSSKDNPHHHKGVYMEYINE